MFGGASGQLLLRTAIVAVAAGASGTAYAAEATISPGEEQVAPAKVELIDNSRLGCGQDRPMWTNANGGGQCAFDTATRGARAPADEEAKDPAENRFG